MKRVAMFVLFSVCLLIPATAHANDGGWWDFFWKWDPKFMGGGAEIHLLCLDAARNNLPNCEQWFKNVYRAIARKPIVHPFNVAQLKHQIDFRFSYYRNYGARYSPPHPPSDGGMTAMKLMAVYGYHINQNVAVQGGVGVLPVWGERFPKKQARGILSAGVLVHIPKTEWLTVRPELGWIPGGFSGADFGDPTVSYAKDNIVNFSIAMGIDVGRLR